jgi:hypothetical protein
MLAACPLAAEPPEAREIVRRSVEVDRRMFELAKDYAYVEERTERRRDRPGNVISTKITTLDVVILEGRPFRRKVAVNGRPVDPREAAREAERLEKALAKLRAEKPVQREKRRQEEETGRRESRAFLHEIPNAFRFTLLGEERVDGAPVWVIEAEPRPEFRSPVKNSAMLKKFRGRLWIDQAEYNWVKAEVELLEGFSYGLVLFRMGAGARMSFAQTRVNSEVWLPSRVAARLEGRLGLVKKVAAEMEIHYRDYRKFVADSRLLPATEAPPEER